MSKEQSFDSQTWGQQLDAHETSDSLLHLAENLRHTEQLTYTLPTKAKRQLRRQLAEQATASKRPFFSPRTVAPALVAVMAILIGILVLNGRFDPNTEEVNTIVLDPVQAPPSGGSPTATIVGEGTAVASPTTTSDSETAVAAAATANEIEEQDPVAAPPTFVVVPTTTPTPTLLPTATVDDNATILDPVQQPPTAPPQATGEPWPTPTSVNTQFVPPQQAVPTATLQGTTVASGAAAPPAPPIGTPAPQSDFATSLPNTNNGSDNTQLHGYIVLGHDDSFRLRTTTIPAGTLAINNFVDTQTDNLSTFALEVDSGSYTIMRNHVINGLLPSPTLVRPEEYINYFDANYPPPEVGAFNILLEAAPRPHAVSGNHYLVQVGVQGRDVAEAERPDALLVLVIDTSGSMQQAGRLDLVKESVRLLIDELRPSDRISIVTYGSTVEMVLEPTNLFAKENILQIIDGIQITGLTNVEDGLRTGYEIASAYGRPGEINRLILASDGVANVGLTSAEALISSYAQEGISLSTFGFGIGSYNDTLMEQLANQGDGVYAYIDSIDEAERNFVENLSGTLLTIAKETKAQIAFNPEAVLSYRLVGYENRGIADEDFRNETVDAGEIGAGHSATALYEVVLADDLAANTLLFTASVRYTDPETEIVHEISRAFIQSGLGESFATATPQFQLTAVVAQFAEILRDSPYAYVTPLMLIDDANRVARALSADSDVQEFAWLLQQVATMPDMIDMEPRLTFEESMYADLLGAWQWQSTTRVFGNVLETPNTTGVTKMLIFGTDGFVEIYENGQLVQRVSYEVRFNAEHLIAAYDLYINDAYQGFFTVNGTQLRIEFQSALDDDAIHIYVR